MWNGNEGKAFNDHRVDKTKKWSPGAQGGLLERTDFYVGKSSSYENKSSVGPGVH